MMSGNANAERSGHALLHLLLAGVLLVFISACATRHYTPPPPPAPKGHPKPYRVLGTWYQPIPNARGFEQTGIASWYGKKFHGRKTSNGETYDMYALTAAHKTLPLGTYVRVHHLGNGKSVDLRVNDRGPFVRGRIIDLSYTAAKRLDIVGPGTGRVRVVALGAPRSAPSANAKPEYVPIDYYSGNFTFQVGAFTQRSNAERLVAKLNKRYKHAHMTTFHDGYRTFYRVRVGRSNSLEEAVGYEQTLIEDGFPQTFIVAE